MDASTHCPPNPTERRAWLCAAAVITFAYAPVTGFLFQHTQPLLPSAWQETIGSNNWYWSLELAYGLAFALPTARASGLRFGAIRRHWLGVLVVCGLPVVATALVYHRLPERPFAGYDAGLWLLSAPAQELVFNGFLYGRFERLYPRYVHPRLPVRWAVVVTSIFFSAWHLRGFVEFSAGYVAFQLAYTFLGNIWVGLARQWTGSVIYGILAHMACNFIASRPY